MTEGNSRPARRQSRLVLRERVQQRSVEKEILEVFENFPQERISESTQIVEVPMPQTAKETVGVLGLARVNACNSGPPMRQCLRCWKR